MTRIVLAVLVSVLALATPLSVSAQARAAQAPAVEAIADSVEALIESGRRAGDRTLLRGAHVYLDRALTAYPGDRWLLYYRGYAHYVEASIAQGKKDVDPDDFLEPAQEALQASLDAGEEAEALALLASVLGERIGSNPLKGMINGPRSGRMMTRAKELSPDNPRAWLLDGVGAIFTPGMFGGGLDRAEERLRRAVELFAAAPAAGSGPRWGRADAHAWLGQVYRRMDRFDDAEAEYRKALALEPDNAWYGDVLMPALARARTAAGRGGVGGAE